MNRLVMNKRLPCRQKVKVGNVQWVYRQSNTHTQTPAVQAKGECGERAVGVPSKRGS
jgi:hypothetical protein